MNFSLRQYLLAALISALCIAGYVYLSQHAFVKIKVDTGDPTHFRLYWKTGADAQYSDKASSLIQIYPNKGFYTAAMGDLRDATHLRIDPTNGTALFRITEISIYQPGYVPLRFHGKSLNDLAPIKGVSKLGFDQAGLVYQPSSWDSQFEAGLNLVSEHDTWWTHFWRLGIFIALCLLLLRAYPALTQGLSYVPALMLLVAALITSMSIISRPHAHPDEHAHLQAAQYFENHSSFPAACEQGTESTYTNYGTSRLNTNELAYFISGKFLKLTDAIPLDYYLKLRLFNVGLFALLLLLAWQRPDARIVMLPLLISPQFWYVFSYYNSDALAIFTSLLIAYQLTGSETLFKRLIRGQATWPILSFTALSILGCFLLLTKKNFYFFSLFLLGAGLVTLWLQRGKQNTDRTPTKPVLAMLLVAACAFGGWTLYQSSLHDFERKAKILECREQAAAPAYRPSAPLDQSNWSLSFDKRGISINEMLEKGWAKNVFMSAFGNFGYVAHPASRTHYQWVALLLLGLIAYLFYAAARRGTAFHRWLLAGVATLFALLVATTLYKSWTVDYQPQGRYYFAMIPILGALLGWLKSILDNRIISLFVLALFLLGFYAFISIGLLEITKV